MFNFVWLCWKLWFSSCSRSPIGYKAINSQHCGSITVLSMENICRNVTLLSPLCSKWQMTRLTLHCETIKTGHPKCVWHSRGYVLFNGSIHWIAKKYTYVGFIRLQKDVKQPPIALDTSTRVEQDQMHYILFINLLEMQYSYSAVWQGQKIMEKSYTVIDWWFVFISAILSLSLSCKTKP